jgi:pimeloyl-ACP methyl ester carboxylesterase
MRTIKELCVSIPTLNGITAQTITTARLTTRVLFSGPDTGIPVLFVHGNASSATYWEETMLALPIGYRAIAPDQRGYGDADRNQKIDARRGLDDLAEDVIALLDSLNIAKAHVVGHSLGGGVVWRLLTDYPDRWFTATLVCPSSPYGFGGTKDNDGTLCWPDGAGSGGGIVNQGFVQAMAAGDRSDEQGSPRFVMNNYYWKPPFKPEREEELLLSLLSEHTGDREYAGDMTPSANWPNAAPGVWGPINASSPIYAADISKLYQNAVKPHILWVRGSHDQIVSDQSLFDIGTLGALGVIPGWPGADVYPPQPMVSQSRAVLEKYQAAGGQYVEAVIEDTGHTPYIEKPEEFNQLFHAHLKGN